MVTCWTQPMFAAARLWERLTPLDRARLGMVLLAFVLLFIGVLVVVVIAGRMARREVRKPLPPVRRLTDAWARKPVESVRSGMDEEQESDD
jgi:hypothetical protein